MLMVVNRNPRSLLNGQQDLKTASMPIRPVSRYMAVCACAGISRGKCCMRLAVRANPNGSISRLCRSLCRRAMRRLSRRLSPEIRSWTRFYPAKTCRFSRPRPDCVCNVRSTRKSRSHWRPPLYFAAQKETRQFWNGKRTQPMRLRPLKRRNFR